MSEFREVPGLEHLFTVSAEGRVIRKARETAGGHLDAVELRSRMKRHKGHEQLVVVAMWGGKKRAYNVNGLVRKAFPELRVKAQYVAGPKALGADSGHVRVEPEGQVREIAGAPGYCVAENGAVIGPRGFGLAQRSAGRYREVTLKMNGRATMRRVHILVLEAFVGPRPAGMVACHGWNGASDNSVHNLRWATQQENDEDRKRMSQLRKLGLLA